MENKPVRKITRSFALDRDVSDALDALKEKERGSTSAIVNRILADFLLGDQVHGKSKKSKGDK
jgi:predicted transcriptional regulator